MEDNKLTTIRTDWKTKKELRTYAKHHRETDNDILRRMMRLTRKVKHEKDKTYDSYL